jgi:GGDEF domain-containing protein
LTPALEGAPNGAEGAGGSYEPWLFQTMLDELAVSELGIGFIYSVLDLLVERYALQDAVVVLTHDSFGTQMFRAGGAAISVDLAVSLGSAPGVYCEPDVVPVAERDAMRTACQLALSLQLARFSAAHDALTNIANRRTFDGALQAAAVRSARYGWAFTLVLADLNGFKAINDTLGHSFGDDLLPGAAPIGAQRRPGGAHRRRRVRRDPLERRRQRVGRLHGPPAQPLGHGA